MGYSIGGRVLDFYDDVGLKILGASPYREKVAKLSIGDPEQLTGLEDDQFGVVFLTKRGQAIRKYPLNDYTNVVLSNVYFEMAHDQLPPEAKVAAATQIKTASVLFGVKPLEAIEKYASDGTLDRQNYVHLHKLSEHHAESVDVFRQLVDEYVANRDRYDRVERQKLAQAMDGVAQQYNFDIPEDLKLFLIKDPVLDKEAFFSQCAQRKQLVRDRSEAGHLLDEFVEKHASFDAKETVKLLETFDRQFDLDGYWTRGLEPNLVLREKVAYHSVPVRGMSCQFTTDELKSWVSGNGDLVKKMFGKDLADRINADPAVVFTLPGASQEFIAARIEHGRENTPVEAK